MNNLFDYFTRVKFGEPDLKIIIEKIDGKFKEKK